MSIRDLTFTDATRLAPQADDASTTFVMDEDTFRAFYDRTARAVWGYLWRLTGDRQLADDLLQDAYYRFLRAASAYESDAHRRNALFRIATNLARDARRRQLARPVFETHDDERASEAPDPARRVEQRTDLTRALDRLRPRDRSLLWLAYAEGRSHGEIADTIGVKAGSVKLMLFRARRRLAGLLGVRRPTSPTTAGGRS